MAINYFDNLPEEDKQFFEDHGYLQVETEKYIYKLYPVDMYGIHQLDKKSKPIERLCTHEFENYGNSQMRAKTFGKDQMALQYLALKANEQYVLDVARRYSRHL